MDRTLLHFFRVSYQISRSHRESCKMLWVVSEFTNQQYLFLRQHSPEKEREKEISDRGKQHSGANQTLFGLKTERHISVKKGSIFRSESRRLCSDFSIIEWTPGTIQSQDKRVVCILGVVNTVAPCLDDHNTQQNTLLIIFTFTAIRFYHIAMAFWWKIHMFYCMKKNWGRGYQELWRS